jgi:hypothetical protein
MTRYGSLRDPVAAERFSRLGWVVLPLFEPSDRPALDRLATLLRGHPSGGAPFFSGVHSEDLTYRARVDDQVRSLVGPALERHLVGHRVIVGFGLIKEPDPHSDLPPHQDWCVVDEARAWSANLWFPVSPIGATDGRLSVLSGSHRLPPTLRGSPSSPTWLDEIAHDDVYGLGTELDVPVGHAVLHDNRLVHWSAPNQGPDRRPVASVNVVPRDEPIIHWFFDGAQASRYDVDDDFFLDCRIGDEPRGRLVATIPAPAPPTVTADDLARLVADARDG